MSDMENDIEQTTELEPNVQNKAESSNTKKKKSKAKKSQKNQAVIWAIKITIITLVLSLLIRYVTEITSSNTHVAVAIIVIFILIIFSILSDAIGVAATSCDIAPLLSMASRNVRGAKQAVKLVKNCGKVNSICGDVIGDICGIVSGACSTALVISLAINDPHEYLYQIIVSALLAALTVGGKAFFKMLAIKYSKSIMLGCGRFLALFSKK